MRPAYAVALGLQFEDRHGFAGVDMFEHALCRLNILDRPGCVHILVVFPARQHLPAVED